MIAPQPTSTNKTVAGGEAGIIFQDHPLSLKSPQLCRVPPPPSHQISPSDNWMNCSAFLLLISVISLLGIQSCSASASPKQVQQSMTPYGSSCKQVSSKDVKSRNDQKEEIQESSEDEEVTEAPHINMGELMTCWEKFILEKGTVTSLFEAGYWIVMYHLMEYVKDMELYRNYRFRE